MKLTYSHGRDRWGCDPHWHGRKSGAKVEVRGDATSGFYFTVERESDNLAYSSSWVEHPNPFAPLIGKPLRMPLDDLVSFLDSWVTCYLPKSKG